ncbi:MAG: 1,4-beta-xylanase [Planctomycetota bacterium]
MNRTVVLSGLLCLALAGAQAAERELPAVWSKEKAWEWYKSAGVIRGCNYLPRTAVNSTEMWQAETFDLQTISQELGWAKDSGFNSLRVFLQYRVWENDAKGLKERIAAFLAGAARNGISVTFVLFCDCSFAGKEPYLGKQDEPVPGVHNSGWVPSPGLKLVADKSAWPSLEKYVKDVVGSFSQDQRVLLWDLYNEPGNSGMGEKSLPLVEAAFEWARVAGPAQPLTTGPWSDFKSRMSQRMLDLSDVVTFHGYDGAAGLEAKILRCQAQGRPVLCTECLRRQGSPFGIFLPVFAKHGIGWYNWGLVAGRTQTYMPWGSKKGDPMPALWQHDVLHPDGKPFEAHELELIRGFRFDKT